jgi:hypothetical protein
VAPPCSRTLLGADTAAARSRRGEKKTNTGRGNTARGTGAVATAAAVAVAGGGNERAGVSEGVTRASKAAVTTAAAAE